MYLMKMIDPSHPVQAYVSNSSRWPHKVHCCLLTEIEKDRNGAPSSRTKKLVLENDFIAT